jgi:riboflavin kinase
MNLITAAEIHLTDFAFAKLCENKFGINRGIYNTIDSTFYEKGIRDIISRRKTIISFLTITVGISGDLKHHQHKFGHGGLSLKINEFLLSEMKTHMI